MTGRKGSRGGTSLRKKRLFNHGCEHLREWCQRREKADRLLTAINSLASTSASPCTVCVDCSLKANSPKELAEKHKKGSHAICFDRARMQFYCSCCGDYTYMEEYEALSFAAGVGFRGELGALSERETECAWGPDAKGEAVESDENEDGGGIEYEAFGTDALTEAGYEAVDTTDHFPVGLRGLNNCGNTCFQNAILQAFIAAPTLSEHYLSAEHCESNCRVSAEGGQCIECQLDVVISDMFSGSRRPYSPAKFLHTWWMMAGGFLGGYKQQDAHEFFLFILQMLTGHPDSIATSLFIGQVQSRVFCQGCGRNSVQKDEFSHLSLDVLPPSSLLPPAIAPRAKAAPIATTRRKKGGRGVSGRSSTKGAPSNRSVTSNDPIINKNGESATRDKEASPSSMGASEDKTRPAKKRGMNEAKQTSWNHPSLSGYLRWPGDSLVGCLRRYTFAEILDGASDDWRCTECNSLNSRAVKQTSITKLPPVLTMHLKRFEFSGRQARATKLETFVSFPLDGLDMSPYLTSRIDLGRHGVGAHREFLYDAFAVVCHRGSCSGGHYVSYVRRDDKWYLCDDAYVTEVSGTVVAGCQAYMIFYGLRRPPGDK